jgi:hypothetical protein
MICEHDFEIDWHIFKNGTKHLRGICRQCGTKKHLPQTPENVKEANKGSFFELKDLLDDIYCRFPLEEIIFATQNLIKKRLNSGQLSPEYKSQLTVYLKGLAAGESDE